MTSLTAPSDQPGRRDTPRVTPSAGDWTPWGSQREFLSQAKAILSRVHKKLTWDRMAELAEIEHRALKTYRMPENSPDHRAMPKPVRRQIESLLDQVKAGVQARGSMAFGADANVSVERSPLLGLVAPALAALVVRTAAQLHNEGMGVVVSGVTRRPGTRVGLSAEDRRTIALVSRARLTLGLPDTTAEIHNLLVLCTQPFGDWLPLPEVLDEGLGTVRLIDPEQLMPTLEAEGLAEDVAGLSSLVEEQLFGDFKESLGKLPAAHAESVYTTVRDFVVRHPVVRLHELEAMLEDVPSAVANRIRTGFYEPLSARLDGSDGVALCAHCGNLAKSHAGGAGWLCTTAACVQNEPTVPRFVEASEEEHFRLTRGLRQYWLEPGIDEIRLFDALKAQGLAPRLYPHRDRVDIDLGARSDIGLDLKAYASPELLGRRLNKKPGGLAHYAQRWLVVPDWLANSTPSYMDRLRGALGGGPIQTLTTSQALDRAVALHKNRPGETRA